MNSVFAPPRPLLRHARAFIWLLLFAAPFAAANLRAQAPLPVVLYRTEFEFSEGYRTAFELAGQNNWISAGAGGNGIITNAFAGQGQQAFIGFNPPTGGNSYVTLFRPLDFSPLESGLPIVRFKVQMSIIDSTTGGRDSFRWSVYTTNGARLLTLDFDNQTLGISYLLEGGTNYTSLTNTFANDITYTLELILNFQRNRWSAWFGNQEIISLQPITTRNTPLSLGDIDAVYFVNNAASPGNNYMIFDDYTVSVEPIANTQPLLQPVGYDTQRLFTFRAFVEPLVRNTIEFSTDLRQWQTLQTHAAPDPYFEFRDTSAIPGAPARFYRIRSVDP